MSERPLDLQKSYLMKHTTQLVRANVDAVESAKNLETLDDFEVETLGLNDIGVLRLTTHRPIFFDPYEKNRVTGAFILIDSLTNNTVAAGMIIAPVSSSSVSNEGARCGADGSHVSPSERAEILRQRGTLVEVRSASTDADACRALAYRIERVLYDRGHPARVLGADENSQGIERAGLELVGIGAIVVATGNAASELASTLSAARGDETVLRISIAGDLVKIAGREITASTADIEAVAERVVDELEARGRFRS
jgi:Ca2+/Na+ antiporter